MKEALFYEKRDNSLVECRLCPHDCKIKEGKVGICGVRQNRAGTLYSMVYGKAIAMHVDPIEKKPLFHVAPGSLSFSIATVGCNFSCLFCQNADISQAPRNQKTVAGSQLPPEKVVELALQNNCKSIAYTYTEPTIFYEYAYDCARLAHERGILNVFVTNGFINPEPLRQIQPYLDAANVDLKGFDEKFYKEVVGGDLQSVLDTLKLMKELKIWVEVTTLLVPTYTDTNNQFREIARFIKSELGEETPWHISRFYPQYKFSNVPPTPVEALHRAREIGLAEGLRYVYSGNVHGDEGESTYCHKCGEKIIERFGFQVVNIDVSQGKCGRCGALIHGMQM